MALTAAFAAGAGAFAAGAAGTLAAPVQRELPAAQPAGQGRLTWFGLAVYEAALWVTPGFTQRDFDRSEFALELRYLRPLRGADIALRSIEEMRRIEGMSAAQARLWREQLLAVLPDVAPGDRITGVHRPGRGTSFFVNGRPAGEIADAQFSRRFFGIWLAPATAEPGLRAALLGATPP